MAFGGLVDDEHAPVPCDDVQKMRRRLLAKLCRERAARRYAEADEWDCRDLPVPFGLRERADWFRKVAERLEGK